MTHPSKVKGNAFEREIVTLLRESGIPAKRVPLSGAVRGYEGDLRISVGGLEWSAECKRRARAFGTLSAHLGTHNVLFMRDDRSDALALMKVSIFAALARELNFYKEAYLEGKYAGDHAGVDVERREHSEVAGADSEGV